MMHITFSVDFLIDRVSTNMLITHHSVAMSAPKADLKTNNQINNKSNNTRKEEEERPRENKKKEKKNQTNKKK